ncbi:hypothetical protein Sango_0255100, partial [Sesamum angolense]
MPLTIFESLHVGPLKETGVVIQLADRSVVYPEGVLEDVLVQVNELVFPADFYVLDMREDNCPSSTSILLGRPFLKMARTKIDEHNALLVDIVDPFVQALSSTNSKDHVKFLLEESLTPMLVQILEEDIIVDPNISESVFELESLSSLPLNLAFIVLPQSRTKLLPSILQALVLELKELPKHLKILLEEGTKPSREAQRRLNPPMMEVVKKEILKLLDASMIFPISDSQWVSPTQVVPKKTGITVVENYVGNFVPTRVQNGWQVCIDNRKLNAATRIDHFPLRFIDQMLERLAGHSHYCSLDGHSGFHQIPRAPQIKTRRRSHVPLELLLIEGCRLDCAMRPQPSKNV